jgi:hypothetical protein
VGGGERGEGRGERGEGRVEAESKGCGVQLAPQGCRATNLAPNPNPNARSHSTLLPAAVPQPPHPTPLGALAPGQAAACTRQAKQRSTHLLMPSGLLAS